MEYSINFQDNISAQDFNNRANGTLNWIKENRDKFDWAKDPNAYEMTNMFLFGAKYASEGKEIDIQALDEMWNIRSKDFENCKVSENNFIYSICQDAHNAAVNGRVLVNDENSHHALRKMAGIGLYLKQQQRDGQKVCFDNLTELQTLMASSKTLKGLHRDLFDKYKFGDNIEVLCNLMLENNLDDKTKQALLASRDELLTDEKPKELLKKENKTTEAR